MSNIVGVLASLLASVVFVHPAQAIVTWTINQATFNDGGTASGFFTLNDFNYKVIDFDIKTTPGLLLPAFEYTPSNVTQAPQYYFYGPGSTLTFCACDDTTVSSGDHILALSIDAELFSGRGTFPFLRVGDSRIPGACEYIQVDGPDGPVVQAGRLREA